MFLHTLCVYVSDACTRQSLARVYFILHEVNVCICVCSIEHKRILLVIKEMNVVQGIPHRRMNLEMAVVIV